MIKAVIFDMDGLIIDSEEISYACYNSLLEKENLTLSKELYTQFLGKSVENGFHLIEDNYHIHIDVEKALIEFKDIMQKMVEERGVPLKDGLIELLDYLQDNNYKTIIATSSNLTRVHQLLDNEIFSRFDDIICGDEVTNGKPNPEVFLRACEKLGVQANEAIVLEDSEAGIQAAHNANIPVICIPDMKYPEQPYLDMTTDILKSLKQVIDYLKESAV